jgi:hypothetical protein
MPNLKFWPYFQRCGTRTDRQCRTIVPIVVSAIGLKRQLGQLFDNNFADNWDNCATITSATIGTIVRQ